MKGSKKLTTNSVQTTLPMAHQLFSSFQLTYSTADIERGIFYGEYWEPSIPNELTQPNEDETILIVHGDMFVLEHSALPYPAVPLTEQSGLFRIVNVTGDVSS